MGCNCKKGKGTLNNIDNVDYINIAKEVVTDIIDAKDEYSDLDKIEILNVYSLLYPKASGTPTVEDAINNIKIAIDLYGRKYKR